MLEQLFTHMTRFENALSLDSVAKIAVAVSGGPDSMALCRLLCLWNRERARPLEIHALTVDHRLRAEAANEAHAVKAALADWSHFTHATLVWEYQDKPENKIQEMARAARYTLMEEYCQSQEIDYLFVAHHADDQAETFLFRLAKGSGVDGLAAMRPMQDRGGITLCRPLLYLTKSDLVAFCADQNISVFDDPSNTNEQYARIRLRQSMPILEAEGLSAKRLGVTAERMYRASEALDYYARETYKNATLSKKTDRIEFKMHALVNCPEEVLIRVIKLAMADVLPRTDYGARAERIESLVQALMSHDKFKARTLGGLKFEIVGDILRIVLERPI